MTTNDRASIGGTAPWSTVACMHCEGVTVTPFIWAAAAWTPGSDE